MKKLFTVALAILYIVGFASAQDCERLTDNTFNEVTDLPSGWEETNTTGHVYIEDGKMVMERKTVDGSTKAPRPIFTMPSNLGDTFEVEFTFTASKNTFTNRIDFLTSDSKYVLSLKAGGASNIVYGLKSDGTKAGSFPDTQKLLDNDFVKNTYYNILLKFKTGNQLDIYVDGALKHENIALPALDNPLSSIKFDFNSAHDKTGFCYLDYFGVFNGDKSNQFTLGTNITEAETFLASANIGTVAGTYPQADADVLQTAITDAKTSIDNCTLTQTEVDAKATTIAQALTTFKATIDCSVDETVLSQSITDANTLIGSAVVGAGIGEYAQADVDAFQTAINTASAVIGTCTTQTVVDDANTALATAKTTFEASVVACSTDETTLAQNITETKAFLASVTIGTEAGTYLQADADILQTAIDNAEALIGTCAEQTAIDTEVTTLSTALTTFKNAIDCSVDESTLSQSITDVTAVLTGATIGTDVGEYTQASADAFQTAINTAQAVIGTCATQTVVDDANTALMTAKTTFEQSVIASALACERVLNETFEGTSLPTGWVEQTTSGMVTVTDGIFQMERRDVGGTVGRAQAVKTIPADLGDTFEVEFAFAASKNHFVNRVDFLTTSGKYWFSLKLGDGSKYNITYALNDDGSRAGSFPNESKLLTENIEKDRFYNTLLKFQSDNTLDIYIDGVLSIENIALPSQIDEPLSSVMFDFNAAYNKTGFFYLDYFRVFKGDRVNQFPLEKAIADAEAFLANATIGTEAGTYPQADADILQTAIDASKADLDDCNLTDADITAKVTTLSQALDTFKASKNCTVDESILQQKITTAQTTLSGATIGSEVGNYPQVNADQFQAVINTASAVIGTCSTQDAINAQVTAIDNATTTFEASKIEDLSGVDCEKLVNDTFEGTALPTGWSEDETKTTGHVYLSNGKLLQERKEANGSIKSPKATKLIPAGLGDVYELSFDIASDKLNFNNRADFTTAGGQHIFSLKFGDNDKFNITYAYNVDGSKFTATFPEENKLLDNDIQINTFYNITFKFKAGNKMDLFVEGVQKLSDIDIFSTELAKVRFDFNSIQQEVTTEGIFTIDNFVILKGDRTANHFALEQDVREAQTFVDNALIGTGAGYYSQDNVNTLQTAIDNAKTLAETCTATENELTQEITTLATAFEAFKNSIDCTVDETALAQTIATAKATLATAVVGTEEGNYTQESVDTFQAAVDHAETIIATCATQDMVNQYNATLVQASTDFTASMIDCSTDETVLTQSITDATTFLASALIGDGTGMYTQANADILQAVIDASQTMVDGCEDQATVDTQNTTLATALETFKGSIDCSVDEATLTQTITTATATLSGATIGTEAGQYLQASADILQAEIDAVQAVVGTCATQEVVNQANTNLSNAYDTFLASVVKDISQLDCARLVDEDYETGSTLPVGWEETNIFGFVHVRDGKLVMERRQVDGKRKAPRPIKTVPSDMGENFEVEFTFGCTVDNYNNRVDLLTASNKYIMSFKFGDGSNTNAFYALNENGSKVGGSAFPIENALLDEGTAPNVFYNILIKFKSGNVADIYADGKLKASNIALPSIDEPLEKIKFDFNSSSEDAEFYLDYFGIFKGDKASTATLQAKVNEINTFIEEEVTVGDGGGEYPQADFDLLEAKIEALEALNDNCDVTEAEIETQLNDLEDSFSSFKSKRVLLITDITLTVNPENVLADKNPLWFGGNNTYNKAGQGLWNVETNEPHYDIMDLASYTGAGFYRFPGGTMANLYKWKRAIGPVEERKPNMDSHSDASSQTNEFGPDEFGKMLQTTMINKGIVVVAFQYETPEDAADYVEYMNAEVGVNPNGGIDWAAVRAENGSVEPYNIQFWEIGNEVYGDWELSVGNYPSDGDEVRGGDRIKKGDAEFYVRGGSRAFTNQLACLDTSWVATSCMTTAEPSQQFYVKFAPVDLSVDFNLEINNEGWTRVDDFTNSTADDMHYTVEAKTGQITFGDGTNGKIPSAGFNIVLDYTSGPHIGFSAYYDAMKAVDPSIEVISCFEGEKFYELMAEDNKPFDGVAKHYYPGGEVSEDDQYEFAMYNALNYKSKIEHHNSWLQEYSNTSLSGKKVKQYLTEFGTDRTISAVPYISLMWYDIINHHPEDIGGMLVHSYFKNDNTPMVATGNKFLHSKAYAYHIFTHLHQDKFVNVDYAGDAYTFNKKSINKTYATASINEDKTVLTVVVPNTTDDEQLNATIDISNYPFAETDVVVGKKWMVTTADKLSMNGGNSKDNITISEAMDFDASANFTESVPPHSVAIYQLSVGGKVDLSILRNSVEAGLVSEDESFSPEGTLKVNGIKYEKGLALFDNSTVTYNLANRFETFEASIGLDDAFTSGELEVTIYGDDTALYTGTFAPNTPTENVVIDVDGVTTLKVETMITDGMGSHLILGNAQLMPKEGEVISGLEITSGKLTVAPNPFGSLLRINLPETLSGKLVAYDLAGVSVIQEKIVNQNQIELSTDGLKKGVYILHFYTKDKTFISKVMKNQ